MVETLIVDGYNIIHAIPELEEALDKSLKDARQALANALRYYQSREQSIQRIYVVYDSKGNRTGETEDLGLIKNIYTPGTSADREIVSLIKDAKKPSRIAVQSTPSAWSPSNGSAALGGRGPANARPGYRDPASAR